jgi:hypothetical protein
MALDDLDLEFEDEEEAAKRKKGETVQQDVDLEFHVPESVARTKSNRPGGVPQSGPVTRGTGGPNGIAVQTGAGMGEVKRLDEARASQPVRRPPGPPASPVARTDATAPRIAGATALKPGMSLPSDLDDIESTEVLELREKVRKVEFDAEVKVQVAEFKAEFIGEMLGDMKLMEHQINQLLVRINAKHPDLKQEALMIKKILADYTTKKRK